MRLIKLQVKGFKGIATAEVGFSDVTTVAGENGSGKSSVLDALAVALGGAKALPDVPVKVGESGAEIVAYLDGLTVRRKVTPDRKMSLIVERVDGSRPPKAQEFLDSLCGTGLAFDPADFLSAKPKDQADALRKLVGLDTSDLDDRRAEVYSTRTATGRLRDQAKGYADSLAFHEGLPETEVSAGELGDLLQEAYSAQSARDAKVRDFELALSEASTFKAESDAALAEAGACGPALDAAVQRIVADYAEQESDLRESIAAMQRKLDGLEARKDEAIDAAAAESADKAATLQAAADEWARKSQERTDAADALAAELEVLPELDPGAIKAQLADVAATNKLIAENSKKAEAVKAWGKWVAEYDAATATIEGLDAEKAARVAAVKWPVDGLGFSGDGVVQFRGIPLSQASQAEQLRTAMAIGLHSTGEVKIILLREASLMDANSRKIVCDLAKEHGAQVVLEIVGSPSDDDENCFIMMDGEVVYPPPAE